MITKQYDIVICGASLGGTIAAYSAAKSGKRVALIEKTSWIGGQLTSQAVPPDEHKWIEEEGCTNTYRMYRNKVREYYINDPYFKQEIKDKKIFCPASSEVSRISHPPKLALKILNDLLKPYVDKNLTIYYSAMLLDASVENNTVKEVIYKINNQIVSFQAKIFIDGTDTGELLPITNTDYVYGAESYSDTLEEHAPKIADFYDAQPSIYTLAFANHKDGNFVISKPKEYDYFRNLKMPYDKYNIFSMYGPDSSTGKAKLFGMFLGESDSKGEELFPLFNYRRIVCASNYNEGKQPYDITLLNWPQNDYFLGNLIECKDPDYQEYMAKQLTLSFFYYLQTECVRYDGGVGYPNFELRYDILGTEDGLSMAPYIRESRRIISKFRITEEMLKKGSNPDFFDSVGVGSYPIDLHITTVSHTFFYEPSEKFTIPLGAMIPIKTKNLIPASKNIGTTHLTNGCYRLHPVEWNIGEVAGFLASFIIDNEIDLDEVLKDKYLKKFQEKLIKEGIQLHWKNS